MYKKDVCLFIYVYKNTEIQLLIYKLLKMTGNNENNKNQNISDDNLEVNTTKKNCDYTSDDDQEKGLTIDGDIYIPPPPVKFNSNSTQLNSSRLVIKQIVCTNFKSYAGEIVIGPFNERFSSIVGPNGSGKSNIIDSMLFVFGFRASKIRTKHISELIHHSSEHSHLNSCTVAVYFNRIIDNNEKCKSNNIEVISGSDFVISKTAFKNNSWFYQLNGKKVQLKEIRKLFKDNEIDLDYNRFLILQGEIEQIAMMKPKAQNEHDSGMLEFLDDIIGTSRYKIPLEQLSRRTELLSENVAEKMNRLRIVESEREQLKESMEKAINYLKIENDITTLKHKLYYCKKTKFLTELRDEEKREKKISEDYQELKEKMELILKEKKLKNEQLNERSEYWMTVQKKTDSTRSLFDKIRKKDEALHAELVEINKRRKGNIEVVKDEKVKLQQLNKVPEKNMKIIKECEVLIEKNTLNLQKEEKALKILMNSLKEKTEPLLEKRTEFEKQLITHRRSIDQSKATFDLAKSEYEFYRSIEKAEQKKLEELHKIINVTSETLKNHKLQITSFETTIPVTKKNLIQAQNKLEEIKLKAYKISAELKKMKIQIEEKKSTNLKIRSRNKAVSALMREKREKRIPGIFGRLGDLGAINIKYDIAISTACGPLDNIVVDTVNTAQVCIEFLRMNDIGRATFIALDKVNRLLPYCKQKICAPENVSRLFDLIHVEDERVLPAFYYGLQDTLVANDLDQATRIAYGKRRHRVVTLKGELIEVSGTMSGGGSTVFKGRMGQSVVENDSSSVDITEMEKTLEFINKEYHDLKSKEKSLGMEIEKTTKQLREMIINKDKFDIEIKTLGDQLIISKSQITIQEKKTADSISNPTEVKEYIKSIELAKIELDKVQKQSQEIEEKVIEINKDIEKIFGGVLKRQQKKIMELTKVIDKAKSEICRLQVAIKTAERNVLKTKQSIETLENNVHGCEKKLHDIQEQKKQCEVDAKGLLNILDECAVILTERDEKIQPLMKELNILQKKEDKMKALEIDIKQKLVNIRKVSADLLFKVQDYETKLGNLKLNQIPGEDEQILEDFNESDISTLNSEILIENLVIVKKKLPESVPNMQVIDEYFEKDAIYLQRSAEAAQVNNQRNKLRANYDMVKKRRYEEFFVGFLVITSKLKEMYQMITLGGAAELELVDSMDPFTEGIVFSVRPPKKSWKNINNLSGGEKTLSSLALVFALHYYKPTPLYFMDEIDAALDFYNVAIVGTYIKERTKNAQFIVVSLRSEMFELSDTLVGIYKTYNTTKCVPFNIIDFFKNHPKLVVRENERQQLFVENCKKRRSQIIKPKSVSAQRLTCPPHIGGTLVDISHNDEDKNKNNKQKYREKDGQSKHNNLINSSFPPAKKQRRSVYRRRISDTSSDNLSSSSAINCNENDMNSNIVIKKRKMDVIKS